jgi:hypothetical protein
MFQSICIAIAEAALDPQPDAHRQFARRVLEHALPVLLQPHQFIQPGVNHWGRFFPFVERIYDEKL